MQKNKTIIITGASSGIGHQLALEFAKPNINLVLAARSLSKLEELVVECKKKGANALAVRTDVSVPQDCEQLIVQTLEVYGQLDILINNAGITMHSRFDEIEDCSIFEKITRVNLLGTIYCTYHALDALKQTKGIIVGISSLQGLTGFPLSSIYSASKFAVRGFLDSIRMELENDGVHVLSVYPGPVDTNIHSTKLSSDGKMETDGVNYSKKKGVMPVGKCAQLIIKAINSKKRELIMTISGKFLPLLHAVAPKLVDNQIQKAIKQFYNY